MNDPSLPNYHDPALKKLQPALKLCFDVWNGLYGLKADYLPQASREPRAAYDDRVNRAVFNNKYRAQVESISGLLTAFDVEGYPASFEQAEADGLYLDGNGSDWTSFLRQADELALRDGLVYVLTNNVQLSPEDAATRTAADRRTYPQWTLVDRRNVINWRGELRNGSMVLTQVTIVMHRDQTVGSYGSISEPYYHTFRLLPGDGGVSLTVARISDRGAVDIVDERTAPVQRIPLQAYPDVTNPFPHDGDLQLPYLLKAAELNIKLFRQESSLDTIQYRVNAPTVYRVSSMDFTQRPPIIFGPNHVIELMRDSNTTAAGEDSVGVIEITGQGIAELRESCNETRRAIDEEGVGFIGGGSVQRSATEAYLAATRASASLNGYARAKSQAVKALVADWCLFTGEDPSDVEVEMDQSVLEMPLDAQEMGALLGLWQAGAIDHQTLLELLRMGRQLPPGVDIEEIMQRVAAERDAAMPTTPEVINGILMPASQPGQPEAVPED
jgi:hypothetical protein